MKNRKMTQAEKNVLSIRMRESWRRRKGLPVAEVNPNGDPQRVMSPSAIADSIREELLKLEKEIAVAQASRNELLQAVKDLLSEFTITGTPSIVEQSDSLSRSEVAYS